MRKPPHSFIYIINVSKCEIGESFSDPRNTRGKSFSASSSPGTRIVIHVNYHEHGLRLRVSLVDFVELSDRLFFLFGFFFLVYTRRQIICNT